MLSLISIVILFVVAIVVILGAYRYGVKDGTERSLRAWSRQLDLGERLSCVQEMDEDKRMQFLRTGEAP